MCKYNIKTRVQNKLCLHIIQNMTIDHTLYCTQKAWRTLLKKSFLYTVIHRKYIVSYFLFKTSYILWGNFTFSFCKRVYLTTLSPSRLYTIGAFHIAYEIPTMQHLIKCTTHTNLTMIRTISVILNSLTLCFIFYSSKTVRFQHGTINFLLIMLEIVFFI